MLTTRTNDTIMKLICTFQDFCSGHSTLEDPAGITSVSRKRNHFKEPKYNKNTRGN